MTNERRYAVPYVSYVPEININVLSMKQLVLQGFEVEVNDSKCNISHMCDDQGDEVDKQGKFSKSNLEKNQSENQPSQELEVNTNINKDQVEIDGNMVSLNVDTFDEFTTFMKLANANRIAYKNKELFTKKFEDMLVWFHKNKSGDEIRLPPTLSGLEVCLFDLYKLIIGLGGYDMVSRKEKWREVTMSFGYPECYNQEFKELFELYLLHPHTYYEFAKEWLGKIPNGHSVIVGGVTNKTEDQPGWMVDHKTRAVIVGGVTNKTGDQPGWMADHNTAVINKILTPKENNQVATCIAQEKEDSEEEDPSITEYYSDKLEDTGGSIERNDDYVIII